MNEAVIEARDITKQYKDLTALDHVDITVRRGEIYGLIGDNGAGKSTFLKIVAGQIFPTGGALRLFGNKDEKAVQKSRSRMGALVENAGFFPKMSVEKNLEYYRIQRGIPGKETVESALRTVNLLEKRRVKCEKLSMGMKQRFGLALALLGEPELLLLDEPINGLALREKCSGCIDLRLTEPDKYAAVLEKELPGTAYQVLQDQTIRIVNPGQESARYGRLAYEHGIGVQGLDERHMSLEDYYVNIKNRGKL